MLLWHMCERKWGSGSLMQVQTQHLTNHTIPALYLLRPFHLMNMSRMCASCQGSLWVCVHIQNACVCVYTCAIVEHEVDPKLKKMCSSVLWWLIWNRPYRALRSDTYMSVFACMLICASLCLHGCFSNLGGLLLIRARMGGTKQGHGRGLPCT